MNLAVALKGFRRGAHLFGPDWRAVVLLPSAEFVKVAFQEATALMDGSSHGPGLEIMYTHDRLVTANGARIDFRLSANAGLMQGYQYAHIVVMHPIADRDLLSAKLLWRSNVVPADKMRFDEIYDL